MDSFQVIQPTILLAPYVKQYWFLTMENVERSSQRLVPFGSVALSFHRGNPTYSSLHGDYLPKSYLYGITTDHTDLIFSGHISFICIVFQPVGAHTFFRMPLNEVNNKYVTWEDLNDPELSELQQKLNDLTDNNKCVGLIEQFLFRRLYQLNKDENRRMQAVFHSLQGGETDIVCLAETACLGYKQFKRVFKQEIGTNPKDFLQIIRFQKLHNLLQRHTKMTVTQLAYECGYYDKSHLVKKLKEFSGFTPGQLAKACDPVYSGYHGLFRSAFVDLLLNE